MTKHIFPKAQPLSPSPRIKRWEEDGVLYTTRNGRKTKLQGVLYYDSIYYWWYQYLRCSERYQRACQKEGKGIGKKLKRVYDDFGDIFAYADTPQGFWQWWIHKEDGADATRGERLFGIRAKPITEEVDWLSLDDIESIKSEIQRGSVKLLAVPTNIKKRTLSQKVQKLLTALEVKSVAAEEARYHPYNLKVDALSLEKALTVWKLKNHQRMKHKQIADELQNNPRFPIRQLKGRGEGDYAHAYQYDSQNTLVGRFLKKAQKNIEAVERGEFPFGH